MSLRGVPGYLPHSATVTCSAGPWDGMSQGTNEHARKHEVSDEDSAKWETPGSLSDASADDVIRGQDSES